MVVGDIMLDEYILGSAERLSPEAPVPIVAFGERRASLGGAGNSARFMAALGAGVRLVGLVGDDAEADQVRRHARKDGLGCSFVVQPGRPTTLKTRVFAGQHQVARIDREETGSPAPEVVEQLLDHALGALDSAGAILISDYAKGAAPEVLVSALIGEASRKSVPVVIDPKGADWGKYKGGSVLTPNLSEARAALGGPTVLGANEAGARLGDLFAPTAVLLTQGADGMTLFRSGCQASHYPSTALDVTDVTGAGDTVAGCVTLALAAGIGIESAAEIASGAAGIAVQRSGTTVMSLDQLGEAIRSA